MALFGNKIFETDLCPDCRRGNLLVRPDKTLGSDEDPNLSVNSAVGHSLANTTPTASVFRRPGAPSILFPPVRFADVLPAAQRPQLGNAIVLSMTPRCTTSPSGRRKSRLGWDWLDPRLSSTLVGYLPFLENVFFRANI